MKPTRPKFLHAATASAMALIASQTLHAASGSWNVTAGGTTSWSTTTNWTPAAAPGSAIGDVVNFTNNIAAAYTVTLDGTRTVGDLNIGDSTTGFFAFTLSTGTSGLLVMDVASGSATIDFTGTGANNAANIISAPITLNDALVIRSNNSLIQTFSGIINDGASSYGLTFNNDVDGTAQAAASGVGQFVLSQPNTYDGGTAISDVRVNPTSATAFGTGAVSLTGAGQVYFSSAITVANTFNLNTTGWVEGSGNLGALRIDGATLSGTVNLQRNSEIGVNSGTGTITGIVAGPYALTKTRPALLVMSGANTYSGITTVNDGQLRLGSVGALGNSPTIIVENPANPAASDTNTLQLTGGLTFGAGKTLYLKNNSTSNIPNARVALENVTGTSNTWAGNIVLEGGVSQTLTSSGSTLTISGNISQAASPTTSVFIRGTGSGVISGGFNLGSATILKTDAGTWTVSSSGNTQGNVTAAVGTLVVGASNAFSSNGSLLMGQADSNSATLNIGAGFTQEFASLSNVVGSNGSHTISGPGTLSTGTTDKTLTVNNGSAATDITFSAAISGTGKLTATGAGLLALNAVASTAPLALSSANVTIGAVGSVSGSSLSAPSLELSNSTLSLDVGSLGDTVTVGSLTATGVTTINVAQLGQLSVGTYPLITNSGSAPSLANFSLNASLNRATASLVLQGSNLALDVSAKDTIYWDGVTSAWATGSTSNWKVTGSNAVTDFLAGDDVIFPDDPATTNISIATNVQPSSVTFSNSFGNNYTFTGAAGITGAGPLLVNGGGTTTLDSAAAYSYTGPTSITNGTLAVRQTAGTGGLTATSSVSVGATGTLSLFSPNADFTFSRPLTGTGTVIVDPNASGTAGARGATLSGNNSGFTGALNLVPSGTLAANGSFRLIVNSAANLGSGPVTVNDRSQIWINTADTYANNLTLTGAGFQEAAGSTPATTATGADGSSPTVPSLAYGGIGAMRIANNTILTGNVTLTGTTKLMPYGTTATISGPLTNTNATDDLVVGGGGSGSTLILTGDNSGLDRIWINGGSAASNVQQLLQIGNNGTTGTLGAGNVILYGSPRADLGTSAVLRISRSDGFSFPAGVNIIAAGATSADLGRTALQVNTGGTGLTLGASAFVDLSDGVNGGAINVGNTLNGSLLNITPGAVVQASHLFIGEAANNSSSGVQTGGDVTLINQFRVGHFGTETSTYTISGGTLTLTGDSPLFTPSTAGGGAAGSTGDNNINALSPATIVGGGIYIGIDGCGIFNQSGGTVTTNWVVLDNRTDTVVGTNMPSALDQYNLSGGTLALKSTYGLIQRNSGEVNFSGGTITVNNGGTGTGTGANLTIPLDAVFNVSGAGAILDTNGAGNQFTLTRNITGTGTINLAGGGGINLSTSTTQTIAATLSGSNTINKIGSGTTTLSANSPALTGALNLTAGRLNLNGTSATQIVAADGTSLGGEGTTASLTLGSGGTTSLYVDGSTPGALTSTGALTVNGTVNIDLTAAPSSSSVALINYASTSATAGNFSLLNPGNYRAASFSVGANALTLELTQKSLAWSGATTTWEIGGADNDWNSAADNFFNGDNVTFDESTIVTPQTITLVGTLLPTSVVVNNPTQAYSLAGAGGIGGTTSIVKSGAAALTLGGANSFIGGITVNEGTLNLATGATQALGASGNTVTVNAGGQVNFKGVSLDTARSYSFSIAGNGPDGTGAIANDTAVINQNSRIINLSLTGNASVGAYGGTLPTGNRFDFGLGGTINGNGFTLTKLGDAMVDLRGPATNISYVVSAGTLRAEDSDLALGSTGVSVATGATLDSYGNRTLSVPVTFASGSFLTSSNSTGTWTGPISLGGGTVTLGGAGTLSVATDLSETAPTSIAKVDNSTTVLTGTNAFTGKTTVSTGILRISSDAALGTAPVSPLSDSITLQTGGRIQAGNATVGLDLTLDSKRGVTLPSGDGGFHVWTGFTLNYAGGITGSGNLTKTDGGVLNYSGSATHTGATTFSVGTTNLNAASLIGTNSVNITGGTTNVGTGTVVTTTGSLRLTTATLNITGGTITSGRFITDDASATSSTINQSGGSFTITGTDSTNTNTASFLFGHWGATAPATNTSTYNLSGGTLNSTGAEFSFGWDTTFSYFNQTGGTANLLGLDLGNSRNNTAIYSLNGGTLNLGTSGVTTNVNKFLNLGGGTLGAFANWTTAQAMALSGTGGDAKVNTLDSVDNTTARTVTMNGILSGPGGLVKQGDGILNLGAINTYTGGTTVNGGVLNLTTGGASGAIRGTVTVNTGGVLRAGAGDVTGYNTDATRLAVINLAGGEFNINTITNQTLGSAVINLTGGSVTGIATSNLDFFQGSSALNSLASATTSTVGGAKITIRQAAGLTITTALGTTPSGVDLDISSVVASNGGFAAAPLVKAGAGTLVLSGANTHTGGTNVNAGVLKLGNASALGTGAATIASGATLDLGGAAVTNSLTLAAGSTLIGSGTANAASNAVAGNVSPGNSAGTVAFSNTSAVTLSGTCAMQIGGTTGGTFDVIASSGPIIVTGVVNVSLINGFNPVAGNSWDLFADDGSFTGSAATLNLPALSGAIAWDTSTFATTGVISIVSTDPLPSWAATFGLSGGNALPGADPDGDGISNAMEYALGISPIANNGPEYRGVASTSSGALTLTYRRPLNGVSGVTYGVEFKTADLVVGNTGWTLGILNTDYTQSVTPNGDGTTETVTINLTGAVSGKKFARVAISY